MCVLCALCRFGPCKYRSAHSILSWTSYKITELGFGSSVFILCYSVFGFRGVYGVVAFDVVCSVPTYK